MNNNYTISNEYGFWDLAGRNLFFRFPRFTFSEIKKGEKISKELSDAEVAIDKAVNSHEKSAVIYVDDNNFKESFDKLVGWLPLHLLRSGKMVDKSVKVIDEIIIKVDSHPFLFREILDIRLKTDRSVFKFATTRPADTYDDGIILDL